MRQKSLQMTLAAPLYRCRADPPKWSFSSAALEPSVFRYHTTHWLSIVKQLDLITLISDLGYFLIAFSFLCFLWLSLSHDMEKT